MEAGLFFYVDESGHTGTHLFDENQPILYYGVLSSKLNLDALAREHVKRARNILGVERLHAAELGNNGLADIAHPLLRIQKNFKLTFDLYRVAKADHALICFFDQVFDQGMNPAITWTGYWTPLRYVLLLKVAYLFDEETLKTAWEARIELNDAKAEEKLISVCETIRSRITDLPDARSRELIGDALTWAIEHPSELYYNCKSKKDILTVTPNIIGFQFVMHGIAARINHSKGASSIIIDQQSQFNKAQRTLAEFYANARHVPWVAGPGMPTMDLSNIPEVPLTFRAGTQSPGLELVDVYLWIFKRLMENKDLAPELYPIVRSQLNRGRIDEVSIKALGAKWSAWFEKLPDPSPEQMEVAKQMQELDEKRRLQAIGRSA